MEPCYCFEGKAGVAVASREVTRDVPSPGFSRFTIYVAYTPGVVSPGLLSATPGRKRGERLRSFWTERAATYRVASNTVPAHHHTRGKT